MSSTPESACACCVSASGDSAVRTAPFGTPEQSLVYVRREISSLQVALGPGVASKACL